MPYWQRPPFCLCSFFTPFAKKSWTFFEKLGRMSEKLSVFSKKQPSFCEIGRHFCRERPEKYMKKHAVARQ